jgi:hypothetical protein
MRGWFLSGILFFCTVTDAQEVNQPQPTMLRVTDSHSLSVPGFMSFDGPQCDGKGNLYFRPVAATGRFSDSVSILRIDLKTETPTKYDLPPEVAAKFSSVAFSVTNSGRVWLLEQDPSDGYAAFGFDSNGKMTTSVHLRTPAKLLATWFRVADDSTVLVAGHFTDEAPKEMQGKPYLAIFDKNGNLRKTLGSPDLDSVDLDAASQGPMGGDVALGTDGNFYLLQRDNILVISEYGEIVRQMKFARPGNDAFGDGLELADGFLSIRFVTIDKDHSVHTQFLVLYAANGANYALYGGSDELGKTSPLCFTGRSGYLFEMNDHGRIKLLTEALR